MLVAGVLAAGPVATVTVSASSGSAARFAALDAPTAVPPAPAPTSTPLPPSPPPSAVVVPTSLAIIDPACLEGSWTTAPGVLDALSVTTDPAVRVVGGTSVMTITAGEFSWEAAYTVETVASSPTATVPVAGVVTQADVWWLQRGRMLVDGAVVTLVVDSVGSGVTATRAHVDGAWMTFPGGGEAAAPTVTGGPATCIADRFEIYVGGDATVAAALAAFDRRPER